MPYGSVKVDSIVTSTKTVTVDNLVTTTGTQTLTNKTLTSPILTSLLSVSEGNIALHGPGGSTGVRTTERLFLRSDAGSTNGMAAIGINGAGTNGFLGEIKFYTGASDVFNTSLSERLRIDSSGRLLVGTSSNWAVAAGTGASLQIASTIGASIRRTSEDNSPPNLSFAKARGTVDGSFSIVQLNDNLGEIRFAGFDGSTLVSQGASISAFVDGTPGTNDMPGRLVFSTTADGASSPTERMRINSVGEVIITGNAQVAALGIGQAADSGTKLDLAGRYAQTSIAVAALDIDCSLGNYFTKTVNDSVTFTVSNIPASRTYTFAIHIYHTSGSITWFSGVRWPKNTAPTLTTARQHTFIFTTHDGGTNWFGSALVDYTT